MRGFARTPFLFADDFDTPAAEAVAEPEVIEPSFTAADLAAAREQGWADGHAAALSEASRQRESELAAAAASLADQLAALHRDLRTEAEERADALSALLLDVLAALFPALCAAHNEGESLALLRALLPGLTRLPAVTIRAHPSFAGKLSAEIARHELAEPGRINIQSTEAVAPGDIRIFWTDGGASRDVGQIWARVSDVLRAAGFAIPQPDRTELDHAA